MKNLAKPKPLRIIGGQWRGRRIAWPKVVTDDLRPTLDRAREDLFNWLQSVIVEATCLDLFAGCGMLGWEAASRGAAKVTMVELQTALCRHLETQKEQLGAQNVIIHRGNGLTYLATEPWTAADVVFLDPPFHSTLLADACALINANPPGAHCRFYVEAPKQGRPKAMATWTCLKEKTAGGVSYGLYAHN